MVPGKLHSTQCAICKTQGNAIELYPANFVIESFNPKVFSARRLPDRTHYRIVRCNACGLVRSDPVAESGVLAHLYSQSSFIYAEETENLKATYGRYLAKLEKYGLQKNALLEIGCGNGFFLQEALRQGYASVQGVEPSADAVSQAAPSLRPRIACGMFKPGLFEEKSFDVICLFQTLDHVSQPRSVLDECWRILRSGGFILAINHNVDAVSARLLGNCSPIIDIEHTYLYSPDTARKIFSASRFEVKEAGVVFNRYSLRYVMQLMPFPRLFKHSLLKMLRQGAVGRIVLSLPLGNLYTIARKLA